MKKQFYDIFVSCYGTSEEDTIHWLTLNRNNFQIEHKHSFNGIENPSYITFNRLKNRLYAVSEVEQGEVVSFHVDDVNKKIVELNRQPTKGGPCYLEVSEDERYLLTANYGGGSIIVHELNDNGEIERETDYKRYDKHGKSHIHIIRKLPTSNHYIATDLGLNKLYFYRLDMETGQLIDVNDVVLPTNSGPRHIEFHPYLNIIYVVNEFNSKVLVYRYDEKLNDIHLLQSIGTIPDTFVKKNYGADIHVTTDGKYLYVSNRGHDSITSYMVEVDGKLSMIAQTNSVGNWPRNFTISPDDQHLFVANEHSNNIVPMKVLPDGNVQQILNTINTNRPVCLQVKEVY